MIHRLLKCKPEVHHHPIDYIAEINAVINGIALYPQLAKVIQTHSVANLSSSTFLILFCTNIIWTIYGLHRRDAAVLATSVLVVMASGTLLALSLLWKA